MVEPVTLFALSRERVNVTIVQDNILEETENFFLVMELRPTDLNVVVDPAMIEISISDDDSEYLYSCNS